MRNAHERRLLVAFLAVLALLTAARIAYVASITEDRYFTKYTHFADRAIAGDVDRDRLPDLSPGYLWFVALLRWAGADLWTLRGVQIAMTAVVAGCVALIAYRVSGTIAAIAAAAIVLTNKAALVNASDFEPETLILMLEAIALALLVRPSTASRQSVIPSAVEGSHATDNELGASEGGPSISLGMTRSAWSAEIAGGLCLGLATICRPVALLMVFPIGVWLWRSSRRFPLAFGIAVALPVIAIMAVNARLTGSALIMDPGTVLYEGMNARTTGCTGSRPTIIRDLEPTISTPDSLHVAYRIVAGRALGVERIPREQANDYWMQKTIAFVRAAPGAAAKLTAQKALAALHGGDAYDLYGMARTSRMMTIPIWISWAVVIPLAIAGAVLVRRAETKVLAIVALCAIAPMLLFFVSARHRNPLLAPAAVLGGLAVAEGVRRARDRDVRIAFALVAGFALLLSIESACTVAEDHYWRSSLTARRLAAQQRIAEAATWLPEAPSRVPPEVLRRVIRAEIARADDLDRFFQLAIALDNAGASRDAERLFAKLIEQGYMPPRTASLVPSVEWYRGRSLVRAGRTAEGRTLMAQPLLDEQVLAVENPKLLRELYDPFTADLVMLEARLDACGRSLSCAEPHLAQLRVLGQRVPKWWRPAAVAETARARIASLE